MPYKGEHAARLKDPKGYETFRRENDKFGAGVHAIWGITEDGKAELQSIRFDAKKFNVTEAKEWLEEHGHKPILFEPASAEAEIVFQIQAAADDDQSQNARVTGVAYSGGKMRLPGWRHPVVVDLAGLEIPDSVPLLTNHENRTGNRVGVLRAPPWIDVDDDAAVVEVLGDRALAGRCRAAFARRHGEHVTVQVPVGASVPASVACRDPGGAQVGDDRGGQFTSLREEAQHVADDSVGVVQLLRDDAAARLQPARDAMKDVAGALDDVRQLPELNEVDGCLQLRHAVVRAGEQFALVARRCEPVRPPEAPALGELHGAREQPLVVRRQQDRLVGRADRLHDPQRHGRHDPRLWPCVLRTAADGLRRRDALPRRQHQGPVDLHRGL